MTSPMRSIGCVLAASCLALLVTRAQQIPDRSFSLPPFEPKFTKSDGPTVLIDAGHNNLHAAEGGYSPSAAILRKDGFRVKSVGRFTRLVLEGAAVLMIVNALDERNTSDWEPPIHQAISPEEIQVVVSWVESGGGLMLIADHQPFPAAVSALASAFGFEFHDGWAVRAPDWSVDFGFRRSDGSLAVHLVTEGYQPMDSVHEVMTFGGSAFRPPPEAVSLLSFGKGFYSFQPKDVTAIDQMTDPHIVVDGWSQGAIQAFGKGRIAVFGEAAMFTAQLAGPDKVPFGLNVPEAKDNLRLLLNTVRWLSSSLN